MSASEFKAVYLSLAPPDRVRLLARFAFDLTIDSRDTYESQTDRVADPARLRGINELQHRVLSRLAAAYDGEVPTTSDEESFAFMIAEAADELRCGFSLSESVKWFRQHWAGCQSKAV